MVLPFLTLGALVVFYSTGKDIGKPLVIALFNINIINPKKPSYSYPLCSIELINTCIKSIIHTRDIEGHYKGFVSVSLYGYNI